MSNLSWASLTVSDLSKNCFHRTLNSELEEWLLQESLLRISSRDFIEHSVNHYSPLIKGALVRSSKIVCTAFSSSNLRRWNRGLNNGNELFLTTPQRPDRNAATDCRKSARINEKSFFKKLLFSENTIRESHIFVMWMSAIIQIIIWEDHFLPLSRLLKGNCENISFGSISDWNQPCFRRLLSVSMDHPLCDCRWQRQIVIPSYYFDHVTMKRWSHWMPQRHCDTISMLSMLLIEYYPGIPPNEWGYSTNRLRLTDEWKMI